MRVFRGSIEVSRVKRILSFYDNNILLFIYTTKQQGRFTIRETHTLTNVSINGNRSLRQENDRRFILWCGEQPARCRLTKILEKIRVNRLKRLRK